MKLTSEEETYLRSYFTRSNRATRIFAWIIVLLTAVLALFIIFAFMKSSYDRRLLLFGAIGIAGPLFLIRFLFTRSSGTEIPHSKEKIFGKLRTEMHTRFRMPDISYYIDDHYVVFLDNWIKKSHIKDGDEIAAWAVPMKYEELGEQGILYLILSVEGKYSQNENAGVMKNDSA